MICKICGVNETDNPSFKNSEI